MKGKFLPLKRPILLLALACAVFLANIAAPGKRDSSPAGQNLYSHLQVYSEALYHIRAEYVDEPNLPVVISGSLHGLLEALDANSSYLSPAEYRAFKQNRAAGTAHIGAVISKRFGYAAVVAVIPGGPADKAAISSGDIIEAFDGKSTHEMSLAEIRARLTGASGSHMELMVIRVRKIEPQKIVVIRSAVAVPPVQQEMLSNQTGYIQTFTLNKGRAQEIATAIKSLQKLGATRLVLDLRDCAEGTEEEGVAVANLFLNHGLIASLEGKKFGRTEYKADPNKTITALPLAVLVNRGTAGPAELTAAAILDNQRGDLVGDKTFGDSSVQELIEMPDGSAVILSIAKYHTPKGKVIQESGITPNVEVTGQNLGFASDENDTSAAMDEKHQEEQRRREQLQKALQLLEKKPTKNGERP